MAVTGLTVVRNALAKQIQDATGLRMSPRMPEQVSPPQGAIMPGVPFAKYGITMGETALAMGLPHALPVPAEFNFQIAVIVSRAPDLARAQETLDAYLGFEPGVPTSVPAAIMADPSLGGVVEFCEIINVPVYGTLIVGTLDYFHARIAVNVSLLNQGI